MVRERAGLEAGFAEVELILTSQIFSIVDDAYLSLARELINWLMDILRIQQDTDQYESRVYLPPHKLVFN